MTVTNLKHYSINQLDQLIMLVNSGITEAKDFRLPEVISTGEGFVKLLEGIKAEKEEDDRRERIKSASANDIIDQALSSVRPR